MDEFYPSEVARLVLGYLQDVECLESWQTFLQESSDLQEHYRMHKKGKFHTTNVNGKSLLEILTEYCALKSESINNEKNKTKNNSQNSHTENLRTPSKVDHNSFAKFTVNQKIQSHSVPLNYGQGPLTSPSTNYYFRSPISRPTIRTPRRLESQTPPLNFGCDAESSKDVSENTSLQEPINTKTTSTPCGMEQKNLEAEGSQNISKSSSGFVCTTDCSVDKTKIITENLNFLENNEINQVVKENATDGEVENLSISSNSNHKVNNFNKRATVASLPDPSNHQKSATEQEAMESSNHNDVTTVDALDSAIPTVETRNFVFEKTSIHKSPMKEFSQQVKDTSTADKRELSTSKQYSINPSKSVEKLSAHKVSDKHSAKLNADGELISIKSKSPSYKAVPPPKKRITPVPVNSPNSSPNSIAYTPFKGQSVSISHISSDTLNTVPPIINTFRTPDLELSTMSKSSHSSSFKQTEKISDSDVKSGAESIAASSQQQFSFKVSYKSPTSKSKNSRSNYKSAFPNKDIPMIPISFSNSATNSNTADTFLAKRQLLQPVDTETSLCVQSKNASAPKESNPINEEINDFENDESKNSKIGNSDKQVLETNRVSQSISSEIKIPKKVGDEFISYLPDKKRKLSGSLFTDTCSTLTDSDLEIETPEKGDISKTPFCSNSSPTPEMGLGANMFSKEACKTPVNAVVNIFPHLTANLNSKQLSPPKKLASVHSVTENQSISSTINPVKASSSYSIEVPTKKRIAHRSTHQSSSILLQSSSVEKHSSIKTSTSSRSHNNLGKKSPRKSGAKNSSPSLKSSVESSLIRKTSTPSSRPQNASAPKESNPINEEINDESKNSKIGNSYKQVLETNRVSQSISSEIKIPKKVGDEFISYLPDKKRKLSGSLFTDTCSTLTDSDLEIETPEKGDISKTTPFCSNSSPTPEMGLGANMFSKEACKTPVNAVVNIFPHLTANLNSKQLSPPKKSASVHSVTENQSISYIINPLKAWRIIPYSMEVPTKKRIAHRSPHQSSSILLQSSSVEKYSSIKTSTSNRSHNNLGKKSPRKSGAQNSSPSLKSSVENSLRKTSTPSSRPQNLCKKKSPHKSDAKSNIPSQKSLNVVEKASVSSCRPQSPLSKRSPVQNKLAFKNCSVQLERIKEVPEKSIIHDSIIVQQPLGGQTIQDSSVKSDSKSLVSKSVLSQKNEQDPCIPPEVKIPSKWHSSKINNYFDVIASSSGKKTAGYNEGVRQSGPSIKIATMKSIIRGKLSEINQKSEERDKDKKLPKEKIEDSHSDSSAYSSFDKASEKIIVTPKKYVQESASAQPKCMNETDKHSDVAKTSYSLASSKLTLDQPKKYLHYENTVDLVESDIGRSNEEGSELANAIAFLTAQTPTSESPQKAKEIGILEEQGAENPSEKLETPSKLNTDSEKLNEILSMMKTAEGLDFVWDIVMKPGKS